MENKNLIGRIVVSKAGRDEDRKFIIVGVINEQYVYICDGDLRKIDNPKKKKTKHLNFTNRIAEEIAHSLINEEKVTDLEVRKLLQSMYDNEEV